MTNCPNCGAPITADICEYCGTVVRNVRKQEVMYADNIAYLVEVDDSPEILETSNIDDMHIPSCRLAGVTSSKLYKKPDVQFC